MNFHLPTKVTTYSILLMALTLASCAKDSTNEFTGRVQPITMSPADEVEQGNSKASALLQLGGGSHPNYNLQGFIDQVGAKLVDSSVAASSGYTFDFELLNDKRTINAFALPGGKIFLTYGLTELTTSEDQLAVILAHEIAHVLGRHATERIQKNASNSIDLNVLLSNTIQQESEIDELTVQIFLNAGYDSNAFIEVLGILDNATGPNGMAEYQQSHPSPQNRINNYLKAIEEYKTKE